MVHQFVHEVAVVRHHHQAAREVHQEFLEDGQREDVQIVGRFVEDQKVGVAHQDAQKVQPLSFSATEQSNELMVHGVGKQEPLEQLCSCELGAAFQGDPVGDVAHRVNDFPVFVEGAAFLSVMAKHHRFTHHDLARIGFGVAEDEVKEGGFARAVLANQTNALSSLEMVVESFKQDPFVVALL